MKLFLKIRYRGTAYAGYQVQHNSPTVQEALNRAVRDLFGFDCDITGCSRTDSGVHALCFCATVQKRGETGLDTNIPSDKIPHALNYRLPNDISVYYASFVSDDFHPRYSVIAKTYEYHIYDAPHRDPFLTDTAYHYPRKINDYQIMLMQEAAQNICGKHDFTSFMASGSKITDAVRNVFSCTVERQNDEVVIRITADGFLYNMVRIICGTLIEVAKGTYTSDYVKNIIANKERMAAGPTLPPYGLYLVEVDYGVDL